VFRALLRLREALEDSHFFQQLLRKHLNLQYSPVTLNVSSAAVGRNGNLPKLLVVMLCVIEQSAQCDRAEISR